ncbi:C2 domain-containing protein [Xylaria sp. CBS 124048]|nr:C2 domain-containing protein [Xylaria sp. CBS 124048]
MATAEGAIDAARDPTSPVTPNDAQKKIVEESANAGVAAFTFNPDGSIEEKRAQVHANIPGDPRLSRKPKGIALVTDTDDGPKAAYELPTPSKAGVVETKNGESTKEGGEAEAEQSIADKVGWEQRFGWPVESVLDGDTMLDHETWLETKVPDTYFGEWYHNAAVIVFACLSSWLVAVLGGGLAWVMIIMAACSTYYRTSSRRVRRNFRDDVIREMALKKLDTDHESLEWINSFLVKFWPIYQPVLAETVVNAVDQVLSSATPGFLDSLKLKTFTLGSKPPRMDHVKTYPKAEDDTVIMDWKFSFTPNDTADMTSRQLKNKINPKVVLEIRIGKAMISKGLDVIVEDFAFSGIMRLKIKLQFPFPHIERVEMCFLERPTIDYVCKPLGGETFGFDINFIPGLESFIQEQIHGNLAPMMYAPNVFPIEVAKLLAGSPVDQAIGVVAVTLHGAQGLKNPDKFSGNPDPYAVFTLNKRTPLAQTKTVKGDSNPRWNETHYIIVTSFRDSLDIVVYDYNDIRKDKELGVTSFPLERLEELDAYENERTELIANGKARGVLNADYRFFPVLEPVEIDGKMEPAPETNTGILRYKVEQAKDLDGNKSLIGQLNPYAVLLLNGKEVHQTKKLKRTNSPIWADGAKDILITDRKHAKLGLAIKDDRDLAGDQLVGTYQIKLDDMLEMMEKGHEWYNLAGVQTGRVKLTAEWKPVAIPGALSSSGGYQAPIGVMRIHCKSASNLRNFETMGKSDPYVRVLLSGIEKGRTVTHRNTLDPEWDQVLYVSMHSPRDRLTLEVMDAEKVGKDRSLGLVEVFAGDYMEQDETGEWMVHDEKKILSKGLRIHGKGIEKGVLVHTVSFFPCLNIADPEDEESAENAEKAENAASPDVPKASLDAPRSSDAGTIPSLESKSLSGAPATPTSPAMPKSPVSMVSQKSREPPKAPPKVHLTPQELLKYESGFLIFNLIEGELPKSGTHLEIFVDDMLYPSYVSGTAKSKSFKFDEIGDCFIRELEFSRLTLKLREKREQPGEERDEDHTVARLSGNTLETLKQCLNNPTVLRLQDEENRKAAVKVSLKYIPVKMELNPSESINNMGNLRVDLLSAANLPAADSNGKSDPYCKFELNGQEVFKSKTQKKTLNPVWNETFEVAVPSRTAAKFICNVYDYDFADKPDFLGCTRIPLEHLDPFQAQEVDLLLDGKSGSIKLRLVFRPDYVTRSRLGTSTFSGTFGAPAKIVTGVVGAPVKGGVAVAGVVGHGVGKGASFIKRGFRSKKEDSSESIPLPTIADVPTIVTNEAELPTSDATLRRPNGSSLEESIISPAISNGGAKPLARSPSVGAKSHNRSPSVGASSVHSVTPGAPGQGTATFTVVSASGYPPSSDVYIVIKQLTPKERIIGKTKHHETPGTIHFDETFRHRCTPDTQFRIEVKGHHTFGSEDELGEALYFVDESGTGEKEIKAGSGSVIIKSTFVETPSESQRPGTSGGIRRGFLSKRETRVSRESTPSI